MVGRDFAKVSVVNSASLPPLLDRNHISHNPLLLWSWSELASIPVGDILVRTERLKRRD